MSLVLELLSRKPFATVGHRGAAGLAPGNTITALKKAIEAGVDIAEFDVQRTSDGVLIASHDPLIRHGGGVLDIRSASYEEVRRVELPGGEHVILVNEQGVRMVVPVHPGKKIKPGLIRVILTEVGLTREKYFKLLEEDC